MISINKLSENKKCAIAKCKFIYVDKGGKDDNFECRYFETSIMKASGCTWKVRVPLGPLAGLG